jgi:hypothetical protein
MNMFFEKKIHQSPVFFDISNIKKPKIGDKRPVSVKGVFNNAAQVRRIKKVIKINVKFNF